MSNRKFIRYDNPLWAFLGAVVLLLIFSWSTSPLYHVYGTDCPFFEIIGLGILQGKIPYVDLFDHKGPLIFFVDALGFAFGLGKTGVFLLQVPFMTVTLFFLYKIARLLTASSRSAFFTVALALIPLAEFLTEGNQCEEWMLPFISSSLYISIKYLLSGEEKFSPWKGLWLGISFATIFYIRPNDAAMQLGGMVLGILILWIVRKQYGNILPNGLAFLGGIIAVSIPVWSYFIARNAVPDFIYGMIIHNLRYTNDALFTWGGIGMFIIPLIIDGVTMYLAYRNGKKELIYLFAPILIFTLILVGKREYYHYLIPTVPSILVCYALCKEYGWKKFVVVVSILFAIFSYRQWMCIGKAFCVESQVKELYSQTDALFDNVPEEERNNIWNYNLFNYYGPDETVNMISLVGAYLHKGITPGNPDFVWFQSEYKENPKTVVSERPKWVVLHPEGYFKDDFEWIFENYELVAVTPSEPVCELRLYRIR